MRKNILLTGKPGIGKTTTIKKVAAQLTGVSLGGFYTEEIREKGVRVGFRIVTLDGREGILAHVRHRSKYAGGRYFVNLRDLEEVGVESILSSLGCDIIVIDEIGKMELFSQRFKESVLLALDSAKVFGVIKLKEDEFTEKIRLRSDVEVIELTEDNRDHLHEFIVSRLLEMNSSVFHNR